MDAWQLYVGSAALRDQWENRVYSCRERLRNDINLSNRDTQRLKHELDMYQTVLKEFVSHLGLDRRRPR